MGLKMKDFAVADSVVAFYPLGKVVTN